LVSGRIKHFISAFGEHVIAKEVEEAMQEAISQTDARVNEFTVAPKTTPENKELPYHEWLVEFEKEPSNWEKFIEVLDTSLQKQNSYYFDLIDGKILIRFSDYQTTANLPTNFWSLRTRLTGKGFTLEGTLFRVKAI